MNALVKQLTDDLVSVGYDVELRVEVHMLRRVMRLSLVMWKVGSKFMGKVRVYFHTARYIGLTPKVLQWMQEQFPGTVVAPAEVAQQFSVLAKRAEQQLGVWQVRELEC